MLVPKSKVSSSQKRSTKLNVDICIYYPRSGFTKRLVGKYFRVRYKKMREGFIKTQAQYRMMRQRKEYLRVSSKCIFNDLFVNVTDHQKLVCESGERHEIMSTEWSLPTVRVLSCVS